jgi:protein TonB
MTEAGFFETRRASPTSLAVVIALHAAALAAVILIKGPIFVQPDRTPIKIINVPITPPPPPEPQQQIEQRTPIEPPIYVPPLPPVVPNNDPPIIATRDPLPPLPPTADPGPIAPPIAPPRRAPVRLAAAFDPRYRDALQPPYPAAEQRRDREGSVRVRVLIGADGRVKEIVRLSATSDAFWEATRRQALSRWRFRPASEDGRPIESSMTLTVNFELTGDA